MEKMSNIHKELDKLEEEQSEELEVIDISESDNAQPTTIKFIQEIMLEEELSDGEPKWKHLDSNEEEEDPSEYEPSMDEEESDDERDFDKLERKHEKEYEDKVEVNDWVSDGE